MAKVWIANCFVHYELQIRCGIDVSYQQVSRGVDTDQLESEDTKNTHQLNNEAKH